jgi:hypothetical protein
MKTGQPVVLIIGKAEEVLIQYVSTMPVEVYVKPILAFSIE